jgi:site-specific DNA-methyltransferase (adenine-specific)
LPDEPFSVCVVAPPRDDTARGSPFNAADESSQSIYRNVELIRDAARAISDSGLMFIYGLPRDLFRYAVALGGELEFRHWIAVRAIAAQRSGGLSPEHIGLILLSRQRTRLNRVRIPHARCRACDMTLKDWGGKSHLMHPDGVALSDVWMDLVVDPDDRMPPEVFERILQLSTGEGRSNLLLFMPRGEPAIQQMLFCVRTGPRAFDPLKGDKKRARDIPHHLINALHKAPCLDALKHIPSETVDLAFADPPFNLTKTYTGYTDDRADTEYLGWCKRWLVEYERVLRPGGSIFILNLPRWAVWLADFLCRRRSLYLQNWIVWNSLPEPKGVLLPSHYSLLYLTKGPTPARFNYCSMENGWEPFDEAVFPPDRPDVCRRRSCVRRRRASASSWRGELTDIWYDIHRVRQPVHATMKAKAHPCETPERLVDRIIRLASNPGDVVLDAFAGTGTTAMVARRLGRQYIAIEQAGDYLQVAGRRVSDPRSQRKPNPRATQGSVSKRSLQIELHRLASLLGRLPDRDDVERLSKYRLADFERAFASWNKALRAAKAMRNNNAADRETLLHRF